MAVIARALFGAAFAPAAETTQYTAPAGTRTIIDKLTAYNTGGAATTLTVKIVPSGGAAAASNTLAVKSLAPGESYTFPEIVGQVLSSGDFISTLAGAATVAVRGSGREVT